MVYTLENNNRRNDYMYITTILWYNRMSVLTPNTVNSAYSNMAML